MKRPSFQFYPGDWQRDTALRSCSVGARGLWFEMLLLMFDGSPYGYLRVGQKGILPATLARMVGADPKDVDGWIAELEEGRVFNRTPDGTIYSRRMVRDDEIRRKRAAGGPKSIEHPNTQKPKPIKEEYPSSHPSTVPFKPPIDPPPAFAFASSSSALKEEPPFPPKGAGLTAEELRDKWNEIPGVRRCKAFGYTIRRRIQSRLREHPDPGWWRALFDQVRRSDFLTGQSTGARGTFHASLDWILRPQNLDKVLAGDYDAIGPVSSRPPLPSIRQQLAEQETQAHAH